MLVPNTLLQNRYRVIRELGRGGMGTVYEALDQRVNCIVALKETTSGNDNEARCAFEREASLLGNLRHSGLPKVMDYFTDEEGDFLIMEFIPGYDLAELLELRGSPFPQAQVIRWADELLKVLHYLHSQQLPILHRDIKPSNLKLTKQGELFLLDFGLAKGSLGQMATLETSRSVRGYTPVYASLEQIHGQGTDARSDLYSLGATLYHLLAGVKPIDAPARFHAVENDRPDPLQPIEKVNPQASPNVAAVIHQAMAVSRRQRPVGAADMRRVLRNAVEEDERTNAEAEYRRAEIRRGGREVERRLASDEADRRVDEARRLQEVHAAKKADARNREVEAAKQEAERQKRQAEEKEDEKGAARRLAEAGERAQEDMRHGRAKLQLTIPATPRRAVDGARSEGTPDDRKISQPAIKTILGPPPEKLMIDSSDAELTTRNFGSKRIFLIAGVILTGVLAVAVAGAVMLWPLIGITQDFPGAPESQTESEPSAKSSVAPSSNLPRTLTNQEGIEFVLILSGAFMMGSAEGHEDEKPVHHVKIIQTFYMGKYEVTQMQWQLVMGNNPSTFKNCHNCPVEQVSWDDTRRFIDKLNAGNDGFSYRLATEAEWEYACRAGTTGEYSGILDDMAWYQDNSGARTHPVGQKQANAFGLYDMHGNVREWCRDWYATNYYSSPFASSPAADPHGPSGGQHRVLRGGSWINQATLLRSAYRDNRPPDAGGNDVGFRLVAVARAQ